ncbi:RNA polymerase Rpb4/RPC9 core [Arabidopsis thaliana x Arabidopsis arenosa]|uniref:RNA polymerase Rpb4/RPC9 core n=1 Tax=Arabidopsis thaliana x Arabidopsis arenosa TaxID=1240361 RepID=A0A8T1XU22_9BRAS|nr:RNA polymerase Rpb4/RPC9 core [Arabidopsis thaliana x Arabidopsis arenosa]
MKIVKANAGALTNFEVLDFLNSRGASKDTTRVIAPIARSEYKVYDYLVETAASTQTRESVTKFADKCKDFKVAKAEILNIINLRPSSIVELLAVCVFFVCCFYLITLPNVINISITAFYFSSSCL